MRPFLFSVHSVYLNQNRTMLKSTFTILFLSLFSFSLVQSQTAISIGEARAVDAEGSLMLLGQSVELTGIAIGPNFRSGGHTWVLYDVTNGIGITVFDFGNDQGYNVTDGDELRIVGELDEFNGLAEIVPETIDVLSSGNAIPDPLIVTELNETTEANLITIENVMLADPSQWGSSNFNVDLTDGTNTFQMRIDGDIDIAGMAAPQGTFNVTGVGGQFDSSAPYFQGYQIFPRSAADIDPYDTGGNTGIEYTEVSIEDARAIDLNGNINLLDENIAVRGVTHGINFRPSGLQFTIINENNVGVGIFSSSNPFNYTFQEGDELLIKGKLDQFNGLAQINPDSLFVLSSGNDLVQAREVSAFDETTESSLVMITMAGWVNEGDWRGDGSSFNIDFLDADGNTLTMRIDSDTELANEPLPDGFSFLTGIGGQFDSSEPYDEGYQIFPWSPLQFSPYLSLDEIADSDVNIYPNPASGFMLIDTDERFNLLQIFDLHGRVVMEAQRPGNRINLDALSTGQYMIRLTNDEAYYTQYLYVEK